MLVLAGDGVMREELEHLAGELGVALRVRFLGAFRTPPNILRFADVFLLTSRSEGMPNSLVEAAAVGVPGVVTAVGGVPSLVADIPDNFFMADSPTPTHVAPLLLGLLERDTRDSVREARAIEYVQRHHSPQQVLNRLLAALGLA